MKLNKMKLPVDIVAVNIHDLIMPESEHIER